MGGWEIKIDSGKTNTTTSTVEKKDSIVIIVYKLCAIQDNKREKQGKRKHQETSPSPSISAVPDYTKDA